MNSKFRSFVYHLLLLLLTLPAVGQLPNTLLQTVLAPTAGSQSETFFGYSAAVDGFFAVAGSPYDDTGASGAGVVKIFDSVAGSLQHVIPNPAPAVNDQFGFAVAVSGTRVVIGAVTDDAGATDTGTVYVYSLVSPTPTVPILTLNNPSPGEGDQFGYSVAMDGNLLVVGAPNNFVNGHGAGSAYVYDLSSGTPTVPLRTLNGPVPSMNNDFGWSVAISGTRVVVGDQTADTTVLYSGAAYGYDLSSATPSVPIMSLVSPTPAGFEYFGWSVSLSGTRLVVGAWADNFNNGGAYVYDFNSATPTVPVHTLTNPHPSGGDQLGARVSISGDYVVVGANAYDTTLADIGRAYLYDLGGATPSTAKYILSNPTPAAGDQFGWMLCVSGSRLVISAAWDDTAAPNAGSVYLYDLVSPTPSVPSVTVNFPSPSGSSLFGWSVGVSGTRMVVGEPQNDTGAGDAGSAIVYDLSSGTPTVPVLTLPNPAPGTGDNFGNSIAISGTRVVVGAYSDNTGNTDTGSVYVFDVSSGTPTVPVFTLNNPSPDVSDWFGYSVAISGTRVVVGAVFDDIVATNAGRVYVYELSGGTPTVPLYSLNNPGPATNENFGIAVGISGNRVVVGANREGTGATESGSAYVYDLSSGTPTVPAATLLNPSPAVSDQFGWAVAISGTRVVIACPRDDIGAVDAGAIYVYNLASGTPTSPEFTLTNPSPAVSDLFGYSVAVSGARVAVGARLDDAGATDAGSAYVYDVSSATPTLPVTTLNHPTPAVGDQFGFYVAMDGNTLGVGAPYNDATATDGGSVYVFGPHPLDQDSDTLRDAWELSYWPTTTGHSPMDDDDHDGLVNLLELGFGLNPTLPNGAALPPATTEGNYLTLTLTKQPGVTYEVQSAGSLLPAQPDSFSAASTTVLINNATTLKVRDNFLIGSSPPRFMRVKVTAAP